MVPRWQVMRRDFSGILGCNRFEPPLSHDRCPFRRIVKRSLPRTNHFGMTIFGRAGIMVWCRRQPAQTPAPYITLSARCPIRNRMGSGRTSPLRAALSGDANRSDAIANLRRRRQSASKSSGPPNWVQYRPTAQYVWSIAPKPILPVTESGTPARRQFLIAGNADIETMSAAITGRRMTRHESTAEGHGYKTSGAIASGCRLANGAADVPYWKRRTHRLGQLSGSAWSTRTCGW